MQAEEPQAILEPTELSPNKYRGYKPFQQTVDRSTFFADNRFRGNYRTIHTGSENNNMEIYAKVSSAETLGQWVYFS